MNNAKSVEHNYNGVLPLLKKEIHTNDSQARILKVMIKAEKPLRLYETANLSKMSKERVLSNLNAMISKGLILTKEIDLKKFYIPQLFFWDSEIMGLLYEKLLPFIDIIHTNSDYSQLKEGDNRKSIIENLKMLLRLFAFEIEDTENEIS